MHHFAFICAFLRFYQVLSQWDTLKDSYLANCKCCLILSVLFILHALSAVKGSIPVCDLILQDLVAQCMKNS